MSEKNLGIKLIGVALLVALFAWEIYPPDKQLKWGIDLAGGTKLIYEIDISDLSSGERVGIAEQVIANLKRRVDPDGVRNIVWTPLGRNRIEIQMPAQKSEAKEHRKEYRRLLKKIGLTNIRRAEIEHAFDLPHQQREAAVKELAQGIALRASALKDAAAAYDALRRAAQAHQGIIDAEDAYEAALKKVLRTNVPLEVLQDVLEMPNEAERTKGIEKFKRDYPGGGRPALIDQLAAAHARWRKRRGLLDDVEDLKRLLRGAGALDFRILPTPDSGLTEEFDEYKRQLKEMGPRPKSGDKYRWILVDDPEGFKSRSYVTEKDAAGKLYVLAYNAPDKVLLHGQEARWSLVKARFGRDPQTGRPEVDFTLDEPGAILFRRLTSTNLQQPLCIVLDGKAISAPTIQSAIGHRGRITGRFSVQEVKELVQKLNAGTLPARLKEPPISELIVGPSFGEANRARGKAAAVVGLVLVVVFMAGYYLYAGLIADLAVLMNLVLVLGAMAGIDATFTLPGIAGLILTVGMAVDANVLIFERIREELHGEKPRGVRQAIRNGYDRAFWTIFDANVTTVLSAAILYMVGSEEIKGFAITLGLGIVFSMFTALFVTKLVFIALLKYRVVRQRVPMLQIIKRPQIDWLRLRRYFMPASGILLVVGISLFAYYSANRAEIYDIEFRGGISAQIQLIDSEKNRSDREVEKAIQDQGRKMVAQADLLADAEVRPEGTSKDRFVISGLKELSANRAAAAIQAAMSNRLVKNGVKVQGESVLIELKKPMSIAQVKGALQGAARRLAQAGDEIKLGRARPAGQKGTFEFVTTEDNPGLVKDAITAAWHGKLKTREKLTFDFADGEKLIPITGPNLRAVLAKADGKPLRTTLENDQGKPDDDVAKFLGGVALILDNVTAPQTVSELQDRIEDMRMQPDFANLGFRDYRVFGFADHKDQQGRYSKFAVVTFDENITYRPNDPDALEEWTSKFAQPEKSFVAAALGREESLKQLTQFAPQVAGKTKQQAVVALLMALVAIVAYVWVRFGSLQYGLCAILALQHDVLISVGMIAVANAFYGVFPNVAGLFEIRDFKIDLSMVAALLTIIGYSLNDTIVVFDRIRENRGRLAHLSPDLINTSINQTLSRTLLTSFTTFLVLLVMYIVGGPGMHGFCYTMLVGITVGTYSSIAIAAPLLLYPVGMRLFYYVEIALIAVLAIYFAIPALAIKIALIVIVAALAYLVIAMDRRTWKLAAA